MAKFERTAEREALLGLSFIQGLGAGLIARLLRRFGGAEAVFSAKESELLEVEGIGKGLAKRILMGIDWERVERTIESLEQKGITLISMNDASYPMGLRRLTSPPPLLYCQGDCEIDWDFRKFIAVVGTRQPNSYGRHLTRQLVEDLVAEGWTIVSGGALGIDKAAHETALNRGGRTLVVLGSGLERLYPSENKVLFSRITTQRGVLLSEFPLLAKPDKGNFPQRNRIIAALSRAVVVVQCGRRSGALNTAMQAERMGIPIFAFPGRPNEPLAMGPHFLIRRGAHLLESARDITEFFEKGKEEEPQLSLWEPLEELRKTSSSMVRSEGQLTSSVDVPKERKTEELRRKRKAPSEGELTEDESVLWEILKEGALHIDDITDRSGWPVHRVSALLLSLEMKGVVVARPRGFYERF